MSEREYFDIEGVEGDDVTEEAEAVAEIAAELAPEPTPDPPMAPLADHATSAAAGGKYPTEDPGDDTTIWSPSPGVIGSNKQGFRKV